MDRETKRATDEQNAMIYLNGNAIGNYYFLHYFQLVIDIETVYVEKDTLPRLEDGTRLHGAGVTGIGEPPYAGTGSGIQSC